LVKVVCVSSVKPANNNSMKTKIVLFFAVALAVGFLNPASVRAVPTTYQYTGNPFTDVSGSYTTSMFVTVMVTLASPLAANMPGTAVTPLAFSVSDGVQTFTPIDIGFGGFSFATGPSGNITNWFIEVTDDLQFNGIITNNGEDFGTNFGDVGQNSGLPGHWRNAAPDAGSSVALLSLSLTALAVAAQRFQRAAA